MSNEVFPQFPGLGWGAKKTPVFTTNIQKSSIKTETRISYHDTPMYRWKLPLEFLRDDPNSQSPVGDEAEYKTLMNFFLARKGAFESFLYKDPTDNAVIDQQFGIGDGMTKSFQLSRVIMGDFSEPVHNVEAIQSITVNGFEVYAPDPPREVLAYGYSWNEVDDSYESIQNIYTSADESGDYLLTYGTSWNEITDAYEHMQVLEQKTASQGCSIGATGIVTFLSAPPSNAVLRWTGGFYYRVRFDGDELDFEAMMDRFWESQDVEIYGALQNKV